MKNQLRIGIYLSYVNLALGCLIPFVYTPIMLGMLGQEEYGIYSLAHSVVGYLSLLTFGFGSTIIRYLSKYRAEENRDELEKVFGFFLALYGLFAVLALVCGLVLAGNVDLIFDRGLTTEENAKMSMLVVLMAANVSLSFLGSVFSSVTIVFERYLFRRVLDIVGTVLAPLGNLIALFLGFGSVGMVLSATITQCVMSPVSIIYCIRVLDTRPRFVKLPTALIKEMVAFSVFVFIGSLVDMMFWATDKVILGMLVGSVSVAVYNIGATFNHMIINISTSISGVLLPKVTGMVVTNTPKNEWTKLFIKVGRLQFVIISLIATGFTVFGRSFIDLWVGSEYADSFWIAILTIYPLCIPLIQNTGISFLVAQNKHKFRSIVYLIIAVANVITTYLTVPYMGGIGAALCSCFSYLLGQGLIMNVYYHKVVGLDIPAFWRTILKMAIIPVFMTAVGLTSISFIAIRSWMAFLTGVMLYTSVFVLLMYCFAMNDYEKDIIRKPVKKFASFCHKAG